MLVLLGTNEMSGFVTNKLSGYSESQNGGFHEKGPSVTGDTENAI